MTAEKKYLSFLMSAGFRGCSSPGGEPTQSQQHTQSLPPAQSQPSQLQQPTQVQQQQPALSLDATAAVSPPASQLAPAGIASGGGGGGSSGLASSDRPHLLPVVSGMYLCIGPCKPVPDSVLAAWWRFHAWQPGHDLLNSWKPVASAALPLPLWPLPLTLALAPKPSTNCRPGGLQGVVRAVAPAPCLCAPATCFCCPTHSALLPCPLQTKRSKRG